MQLPARRFLTSFHLLKTRIWRVNNGFFGFFEKELYKVGSGESNGHVEWKKWIFISSEMTTWKMILQVILIFYKFQFFLQEHGMENSEKLNGAVEN